MTTYLLTRVHLHPLKSCLFIDKSVEYTPSIAVCLLSRSRQGAVYDSGRAVLLCELNTYRTVRRVFSLSEPFTRRARTLRTHQVRFSVGTTRRLCTHGIS